MGQENCLGRNVDARNVSQFSVEWKLVIVPSPTFQTDKNDTAWGANRTNSPVLSVNYWYISAEAYPQLKTFPPCPSFW
jgi:hypothetical protein